jgi:plastocyanin
VFFEKHDKNRFELKSMDQAAKQPNFRSIIVIAGIALVFIAGFLIFSMATKGPQQPKQTVQDQPQQSPVDSSSRPNSSTASPTGERKDIMVQGGDYYFKPNQLRVKKGDTVNIIFKNVDGTHDFVIDEFKIKTNQITAGRQETVTFTADKAGTFEFYCSVGDHRQMGMKGTLIVE